MKRVESDVSSGGDDSLARHAVALVGIPRIRQIPPRRAQYRPILR